MSESGVRMPDGTVPSSTEALRAALSAARASLERQLRTTRTDAAEDALRQVKSALRLLPSERICDIPEIEWVEADPSDSGVSTNPAQSALTAPLAKSETGTAAPDAPRQPDDLTRIRGIDDVLSKRLAALGIQRYAQIAAWQPDDVRAIADAMGLGRRFLAMGIVEQATDLDRALTEVRLKDQQAPAGPTAEGRHSVAIWEPKASSFDVTAPLVRAPAAWKPLNGDALAAVLKIIRTKRPMNTIVHLGDVAPVLGQPIYIATDYDAATELPRWRTGVLVPFVEAREAPDLLQLARAAKMTRPSVTTATEATPTARRANDTPTVWPAAATRDAMPLARTTQPSEAANAIAAFHATIASTSAPQPTKVPPLHEQASSRIDDLEAELEKIAQSDTLVLADSAPLERAQNALAQTKRPQAAADQTAPPMFGSRDDVAEADVKIMVRTKARLLAPLPDLPLTARFRTRARADEDMSEDARQSHGRVEEAAVVIVRRATAEPAAAGLAFYTQAHAERASGPLPSNPVRRFMRALAGG